VRREGLESGPRISAAIEAAWPALEDKDRPAVGDGSVIRAATFESSTRRRPLCIDQTARVQSSLKEFKKPAEAIAGHQEPPFTERCLSKGTGGR